MVLLVQVGTLYLVRTDLNCSSVASVRTPVGSKWVRLTRNPASDRYCRNLFSLRRQEEVLRWFSGGDRTRLDSLGHVHATDAVAVDAVVEGWMIQRHLHLQLLHQCGRILSGLPLPCRRRRAELRFLLGNTQLIC